MEDLEISTNVLIGQRIFFPTQGVGSPVDKSLDWGYDSNETIPLLNHAQFPHLKKFPDTHTMKMTLFLAV